MLEVLVLGFLYPILNAFFLLRRNDLAAAHSGFVQHDTCIRMAFAIAAELMYGLPKRFYG